MNGRTPARTPGPRGHPGLALKQHTRFSRTGGIALTAARASLAAIVVFHGADPRNKAAAQPGPPVVSRAAPPVIATHAEPPAAPLETIIDKPLVIGMPDGTQPPPPAPAHPMPVIVTPYGVSSAEEAMASRQADGMFAFQAEVNGIPLPMTFDTGAALVSLRAEDAARVGIATGALDYNQRMSTANGIGWYAPITIRTLKVGTITRFNVHALVARPGQLRENLIGQSFLKALAGYNLDGDRLILKGR